LLLKLNTVVICLLFLFLLGRPLQKAQGFIGSNRIRMKFAIWQDGVRLSIADHNSRTMSMSSADTSVFVQFCPFGRYCAMSVSFCKIK